MKTNLVVNKPTLLIKNLNASKTIKTSSGHTLQIADVFSSAKIIQQNSNALHTKSSQMIQASKSLSPITSIEPLQQIKIDAIVESMVKDSGVDESVLFICGIGNCSILNKGSMRFFHHLQTHKAQIFPCAHCKKTFNNEVDTTNHYNDEHLLKRYIFMILTFYEFLHSTLFAFMYKIWRKLFLHLLCQTKSFSNSCFTS